MKSIGSEVAMTGVVYEGVRGGYEQHTLVKDETTWGDYASPFIVPLLNDTDWNADSMELFDSEWMTKWITQKLSQREAGLAAGSSVYDSKFPFCIFNFLVFCFLFLRERWREELKFPGLRYHYI